MKRLIYLFLVGVLIAGFTAAGTTKAEAMDSQSAALLAGTAALIGGAVIYASALDAGHQRPVYVQSYPSVTHYREVYRPVRTRVIYLDRDHRDCFPDRWRNGYRERHRDDRVQRRDYRRR